MSRRLLTPLLALVLLIGSYFVWGYYRVRKFVEEKEALSFLLESRDPRTKALNTDQTIRAVEKKIERKMKEEGIENPAPIERVSDIGYITGVYTATDFWLGEKKIIWYVKIPKRNKVYVCQWGFGFSGFKKNDRVKLSHDRDLEWMDEGGVLIGLNGRGQGRIANVSVNDQDIFRNLQ